MNTNATEFLVKVHDLLKRDKNNEVICFSCESFDRFFLDVLNDYKDHVLTDVEYYVNNNVHEVLNDKQYFTAYLKNKMLFYENETIDNEVKEDDDVLIKEKHKIRGNKKFILDKNKIKNTIIVKREDDDKFDENTLLYLKKIKDDENKIYHHIFSLPLTTDKPLCKIVNDSEARFFVYRMFRQDIDEIANCLTEMFRIKIEN